MGAEAEAVAEAEAAREAEAEAAREAHAAREAEAALLDLHWSYLVHREHDSLKGWHAALVRRRMEGCGEVLTRQDGKYWWGSLNHHIAGAGGAVTIPASATSIGGGAFAACSGLTSVTFPASVTSSGDAPFYD